MSLASTETAAAAAAMMRGAIERSRYENFNYSKSPTRAVHPLFATITHLQMLRYARKYLPVQK